MQDFINMAVQQLGINESQAKGATGGVLGLLQGQMGGGDFNKLLGMLPGAQDLIKRAESTGSTASAATNSGAGGIGGMLGGLLGGGGSNSGGGLGNLASMASGLLGGDKGGVGEAGGAGQLISLLGNSGLSGDKAGGFLKLLTDYISGKGGGDLIQGVLGKFDLKSLLG